MSKTKYLILILACTVSTGLLVLGLWVWTGKGPHTSQKTTKGQKATGSESALQNSDPEGIPLLPAQPNPASPDGLRVAPAGGNNLGQLAPGSDNANNAAASESAAAKMLDPASFGQYDKYKEAGSALFANLKTGSGPELVSGKKAAVYYKGWLTNGQLFDMSRSDKDGNLQPFVFTLGARQVIAGWEQALYGMKPGGVRLVIVPPAVGYGESGQGSIPGNAVLIFQVQLLSVE